MSAINLPGSVFVADCGDHVELRTGDSWSSWMTGRPMFGEAPAPGSDSVIADQGSEVNGRRVNAALKPRPEARREPALPMGTRRKAGRLRPILQSVTITVFLPAALQAQPAEFTRIGGSVFVGASKCTPTEADRTPCAPRWGVGYRLYEPKPWLNLTGFVGPQAFGLAACLAAPGYHTPGGHLVTFSAGPGYGMPLDGNGLRSGRLGGFFSVSVRADRGGSPKP